MTITYIPYIVFQAFQTMSELDCGEPLAFHNNQVTCDLVYDSSSKTNDIAIVSRLHLTVLLIRKHVFFHSNEY